MKTKFLAMSLILSAIIGAACNTEQASEKNNNSIAHMNHNNMNHGNMNHQTMNHDAMNHSEMKSSPNATNAPYDLQFLDTMIAHHQGAVDMARDVKPKLNTPN